MEDEDIWASHEVDEEEPWTTYHEFTSQFMTDEELLEQFEIQGPGPPPRYGVNNFLPPPPIPGSREDCLVFSSHFDTCSSLKDPGSSTYPQLHLMSVIVAVCCVIILISCITIFLVWKRRQKKSRLAHLQYRLSDSGNFDYFPTRRLNKYYTDTSFRNQFDECGVFYTSSLHPVYEEIPTPQEGEYQLLNSEYSTLPILPDNMVSLLPYHPHHHHHHQPPPHLAQVPGRTQQKTLPILGRPGKSKGESRSSAKSTPSHADRRRRLGLSTLDSRLQGASDTLTYQLPQQSRFVRCNQADLLPRQAWTDLSGSDDWMEADLLAHPATTAEKSAEDHSKSEHRPRTSLYPARAREISPTLNSLESSDVTMSTSSSETYPKCLNETFHEPQLRNLS